MELCIEEIEAREFWDVNRFRGPKSTKNFHAVEITAPESALMARRNSDRGETGGDRRERLHVISLIEKKRIKWCITKPE